jgi:hypothetical protein
MIGINDRSGVEWSGKAIPHNCGVHFQKLLASLTPINWVCIDNAYQVWYSDISC